MTEIVAAHLERVAKELLDKLGLTVFGEPFFPEDLQAVAAALAACAREASEIKIGRLLRIIAELRTSAKDFDSMGYGLFACKMQRLAAELEDLTGRERAAGEKETL